MTRTDFRVALLSGAAAGISVDLTLFPLDTIKTRLQSERGFWKSGGFRGIYSGLLSVAIGSAPTAALFFCTYETVKNVAIRTGVDKSSPFVHMTGASFGEVAACLIRVPVEVVKQRAQTFPHMSSITVFRNTIQSEGMRGMYRGYLSTVVREVPFSFLQFPTWEYFKISWSTKQGRPVDPWQSSICGAVSGRPYSVIKDVVAQLCDVLVESHMDFPQVLLLPIQGLPLSALASGITTPLDVAKTRIMLADKGTVLARGSIPQALKIVYKEKGAKGLFAGIVPRVMWISIGGAIFLGVYDKAKVTFNRHLHVNGYL